MKSKNYFFRALIIGCLMSISWNGMAQQGFCETFDQFTNTSVTPPFCDGIFNPGLLDNWGVRNLDLIAYDDFNSQNGAGDYYLFLDDGGCGNGSSYAYNDVDYTGNWVAMVPQEEGCFCFDLRAFHIQVGTITGYNSLRIYNGPDPGSSTLSATFVLSVPIDVSLGWVRTCAPIALSDGVNLPSNGDGQWVINTGSAADWDTLITGVGSVAFLVDVDSGDERWGIDNICISEVCDSTVGDPEPTNEGAYCCDEKENLVENGNFEFGDTGFSSDYTQNAATLPGQYDVTNSAAAFGASVTDHSFCVDPVTYANNDMYMLVNGRTTQPSGTQSTIWSQTLSGLDPEKEYRFCANFKNMPQCTFDILPSITIQTSSGSSVSTVINTDPSDPCDWQLESFCFRGGQEVNISIILDEDGLGDGNDLAIDDISVQELADSNLSITVQHQGNPQQVTGSINSISTADDVLPYDPTICEDPWYWFVITVDSYVGGTITFDWAAPYGWGNDTGYSLFNPSSSGSTPWDLTTNFVPYPFAQNTLYLIGMYTPSCCEDCVDDGFTYQLIYNNFGPQEETGITAADKAFILSWLGTYGDAVFGESEQEASQDTVSLSPNPTQDAFEISSTESEIRAATIYNLSGQVIKEVASESNGPLQIRTTDIPAGVYMVKVETGHGEIVSKKLIVH